MTFHRYGLESLDTLPEFQGLYGLTPITGQPGLFAMGGLGDLGLAPYLVAGGAVAGAALTKFLLDEDWSTGEYSYWMDTMNSTIQEWDKLGWLKGSDGKSCWDKNPEMRRQFKSFWSRFSKHWAAYGEQSGYLSDSAEGPARKLLQELKEWGTRLTQVCQIAAGALPISTQQQTQQEVHTTSAAGPYADMIKWGAIGLGALVALNVVSGIRGAFPRR
jgi:hypothetical protein